MSERTYLYLLIFPVRGMLKIGKADDIHVRVQTLRRYWGEADYEQSYYLEVSAATVFRLERSLHFLLERYAIPDAEGDGKTELFSIEALGTALKHIDLFCATQADSQGIRKGVPRPVLPLLQKARKRRKRDRMLARSKLMVDSVGQLARQFGRVHRLLSILHRRQSRIAFQYDLRGDMVYFRLRLPSASPGTREMAGKVMPYFFFEVDDLNGGTSANRCRVIGEGDVLQFEIQIASAGNHTWQGLFDYFNDQTMLFLNRLPQRSPAASTPLPLLEWSLGRTA